jgi:hypothetical protein
MLCYILYNHSQLRKPQEQSGSDSLRYVHSTKKRGNDMLGNSSNNEILSPGCEHVYLYIIERTSFYYCRFLASLGCEPSFTMTRILYVPFPTLTTVVHQAYKDSKIIVFVCIFNILYVRRLFIFCS